MNLAQQSVRHPLEGRLSRTGMYMRTDGLTLKLFVSPQKLEIRFALVGRLSIRQH